MANRTKPGWRRVKFGEAPPQVKGRADTQTLRGECYTVGNAINFNRYFYQYSPPRPLEEIETDIQAIEKDILRMLREVAG